MSTLRAGAARANLTPYVGMYLSGFAGRDHGAEGIHDDLWARALVLEAGATRVALVSAELIGFTGESVARIRERVEASCGIPGDHVMVAAVHTHSGPAMGCLRLLGQDPELVSVSEKKVAGAVCEACARLTEAKLGVGVTETQIGINRREQQPGGGIKLGRNPEGPVDRTTGILRVEACGGGCLGGLLYHACHPVVLGGSNYLISADFPGRASASLEDAFPGARVLFVNGCAGNINPEVTDHSFEEAEALGRQLAEAAQPVFDRVPLTADLQLRCATRWAEAPLRPLPDREETAAFVEDRERRLREDVAAGRLSTAKFESDHLLGWARDVLTEWDQSAQQTHRRLEVQAVALGDSVLVGTPGETFVEIGRAIAAASPFEHTFVTGYTNGVVGYLPTDEAFAEGGYEIENAYKFYYGTYSLAPGTEQAVVQAGIEAVQAVWS